MTTPPESAPDTAPEWSFSPEHDIRCPECDEKLAGLNWKLSEPEVTEVAQGVTETTGPVVIAMVLVPCGHELSTSQWELTFSGRDRRFGTVIRTPKFQRIDGS